MPKNSATSRRILLKAWELSKHRYEHANNSTQAAYYAGQLTITSRILDTLHHTGDGKDPIKKHEFLTEAVRVITTQNPNLEGLTKL